jgi:hypothetical protein
MDINASVGTRQPHEDFPACGFFGLQRVNLSGERMKDWLTHNGLCAVSTHFPLPTQGHHFGTWKHPRPKGMHQNDHIFVSRAAVKTVKSYRNFSPLVVSDHLLVKAVFRVAAKLGKRAVTEADELRRLDLDVLRPFCPTHNPVIDGLCREAVRFYHHCPDLAGMELCERGERAMITAALEIIPPKRKLSADWHQAFRRRLDPLCDRARAKMKPHVRQRRGKNRRARQSGKGDGGLLVQQAEAMLQERLHAGHAWEGGCLPEF